METIGAIKGKSNVICFYIFRKSEKSYLKKVIFKKVTKKHIHRVFLLCFYLEFVQNYQNGLEEC